MLKILFGIHSADEGDSILEYLNNMGVEYEYQNKYSKMAVRKFLQENEDYNTVVLLEHLEARGSYTAKEIAELTDLRDMNVIPLLSEEHRGTDFMRELYAAGITSALFVPNQGISPISVAKMITNKRGKKEARSYYEIEQVVVQNETLPPDQLRQYIGYIENEKEDGTVKERYLYVVGELSEEQNKMLLQNMSQELLNECLETEVACRLLGIKKKKRKLFSKAKKQKNINMLKETSSKETSSPEEIPDAEEIKHNREKTGIKEEVPEKVLPESPVEQTNKVHRQKSKYRDRLLPPKESQEPIPKEAVPEKQEESILEEPVLEEPVKQSVSAYDEKEIRMPDKETDSVDDEIFISERRNYYLMNGSSSLEAERRAMDDYLMKYGQADSESIAENKTDGRTEKEKPEQERLEKEKAEKERLEQLRAEKERLEKEKERLEQEKAEREKTEREKAEREKAERERQQKLRAEKERLEQLQAEKERLEKEKAEQERAGQEMNEKTATNVITNNTEKTKNEKKKIKKSRKKQDDKEDGEKTHPAYLFVAAFLLITVAGLVFVVGVAVETANQSVVPVASTVAVSTRLLENQETEETTKETTTEESSVVEITTQTETTTQPATTKKQTETTTQPATTKKQEETTTQPATTKKQTETTTQPATTKKQTETTTQPATTKKQEETTKKQEEKKYIVPKNLNLDEYIGGLFSGSDVKSVISSYSGKQCAICVKNSDGKTYWYGYTYAKDGIYAVSSASTSKVSGSSLYESSVYMVDGQYVGICFTEM